MTPIRVKPSSSYDLFPELEEVDHPDRYVPVLALVQILHVALLPYNFQEISCQCLVCITECS
nr:MAG TPA: hypothetical protein [Caudoviricetes sp.]DAT90953.1 MAG TPA: hypothetical protein [Caudoviricetes sp.]